MYNFNSNENTQLQQQSNDNISNIDLAMNFKSSYQALLIQIVNIKWGMSGQLSDLNIKYIQVIRQIER